MTVADYLISFLALLGVKHVYGYPGSPLVPLLAALPRHDAVRWALMRPGTAAALAPVLALTGLVPTASQGHWEFQDVNQTALLAAVLARSATCVHPNQLVILLRNFVGAACQQQETVHLALPSDVLATEVPPGDEFF